jgi:phage-related protein (TIGR01555 family)
MLLDAEDEWAQVQITWPGMTDVMMAFLNVVAGAADIPVTRLLGQSPKGLQSNGDGEERDYNKMIKAQQTEVLRPALDQIDELLIPSALGSAKSDVYYEFAPLDQLDEKDAATVEKQAADTIKVYADAGIIPDVALSEMAKNRIVESGRWPGSEKAFEDAEAAIAADPRLDPLNPDNQEPVVDPNAEAGVPAIEKVPPKPRKPRSPGQ